MDRAWQRVPCPLQFVSATCRGRQIAAWAISATVLAPSAITIASNSTIAWPLLTTFAVTLERQLLADARGGVVAHLAADVNPRAEHDVLHQRLIGEAEDLAGMRQPFGAVDRIGFANFVEIGREHGAVDGQRPDAERRAHRERGFARRRPLGGGRTRRASTAGAGRRSDGMNA